MKTRTTKKLAYQSKINIAAVIIALAALEPLLNSYNFDEMKLNNWIAFACAVLIVIFRTFFTSKPISTRFLKR